MHPLLVLFDPRRCFLCQFSSGSLQLNGPAMARERIQEMVVSPKRNPKRFLIAVVLFAFFLRLAVMFAVSSYHVVNDDTDHFGFGWEMGRVARSLAEGAGFSSPLPLPTGATAIVGPVYPLLLALVFKIFGVYSTASAIAIRVIQCIFASLTCVFVYLCGRDTGGESSGKLAALLWAVFPLNIFFTVNKVWETSLTAMLAAALFWYMLPLRHSLSARRWAATGALLAIAALLSTSLVVLIIPFAVSALWSNGARLFRPALIGALTCVALASPWMVRNYMQFGKVMLRSNFPLEFRVANNEWSHGQKIEALHPSNSPQVNRHWQDVGEKRFMAEESDLNSRFLAANRGRFVLATANRIVNYWTAAWITPSADTPSDWRVILGTSFVTLLGLLGLVRMLRVDSSAALMYAGCLFIYPWPYYLTTTQPRFYHAITPLLIVLGAFWLLHLKDRIAEPATKKATVRKLAHAP
jgi:4-amino-4-deoxy-L-arabinose transferase-like glycosyltransferase